MTLVIFLFLPSHSNILLKFLIFRFLTFRSMKKKKTIKKRDDKEYLSLKIFLFYHWFAFELFVIFNGFSCYFKGFTRHTLIWTIVTLLRSYPAHSILLHTFSAYSSINSPSQHTQPWQRGTRLFPWLVNMLSQTAHY